MQAAHLIRTLKEVLAIIELALGFFFHFSATDIVDKDLAQF